jgi:hypothetical protein
MHGAIVHLGKCWYGSGTNNGHFEIVELNKLLRVSIYTLSIRASVDRCHRQPVSTLVSLYGFEADLPLMNGNIPVFDILGRWLACFSFEYAVEIGRITITQIIGYITDRSLGMT